MVGGNIQRYKLNLTLQGIQPIHSRYIGEYIPQWQAEQDHRSAGQGVSAGINRLDGKQDHNKG